MPKTRKEKTSRPSSLLWSMISKKMHHSTAYPPTRSHGTSKYVYPPNHQPPTPPPTILTFYHTVTQIQHPRREIQSRPLSPRLHLSPPHAAPLTIRILPHQHTRLANRTPPSLLPRKRRHNGFLTYTTRPTMLVPSTQSWDDSHQRRLHARILHLHPLEKAFQIAPQLRRHDGIIPHCHIPD